MKNRKLKIILAVVIATITVTIVSIILYKNNMEYKMAHEIQGILSDKMKYNTYTQVYVGEDSSVAFLYNKNREAFAQSREGGIAVYLNNDKYVSFKDGVAIEYGVTPIRLIELALKMVRNGKAEIELTDNRVIDSSHYVKEYTITLNGKDKVKELYKLVDGDYANEMVDSIYGTTYPRNSKLDIKIFLGNNGEFGASCSITLAGERYITWYFDGFLEMYDWELPQEWYKTNTSDVSSWKLLVNNLIDDIEAKTQQFASENEDLLLKEEADEVTDTTNGVEESSKEIEHVHNENCEH